MSASSDSISPLEAIKPDDDFITDEDHTRLDKAVSDELDFISDAFNWTTNAPPPARAVLYYICGTAEAHGLRQIDRKTATELIEKYPQLGEMVNSAWLEGKGFKEIRCLKLLRIPLYRASIRATQDSWTHEFVGDAHHALKTHILWYMQGIRKSHAPYCDIIQSTGTGKSRTVDEFSKLNFVIPMNLRKPAAQGFPASDDQVYRFLFNDSYMVRVVPDLLRRRMHAFMFALFEKCNKVIEEASSSHEEGWLHSNGAAWFRDMMTTGQTMERQGPYRVKFYNDVINMAEQMLVGSPSNDDDDQPTKSPPSITEVAYKLISNWDLPRIRAECSPEPVIYLAFDEAQSLTVAYPFPLVYLENILLDCIDLPLFSMFLTTIGKIIPFAKPKEDDSSARLQSGKRRIIPSFCTLGWDQRAAPFPVGPMRLSDVASLDYKARLGRPLFGSRYISSSQLSDSHEREQLQTGIVQFAAQKLVPYKPTAVRPENLTPAQELACLSARIPLEFVPSSSTEAELDQVAHHMRVFMNIGPHQCTSVTPSEPIVSEGAYLLMTGDKFNAPAALSRVLDNFSSICQGEHGELIAMLILTMARDRVCATSPNGVFGVIPFLQALTPQSDSVMEIKPSVYQSPDDQNITLSNAFADVNLHFNHFVKRQVEGNLNERVLQGFIARCAAITSAKKQFGFDIVVPTVRGETAEKTSQGLIMWQIENDEQYSATVRPYLFNFMDPVSVGFIGPDEKLPTPIIRIVFALGGKEPAVTHVQTQKQGNFTSYDIWISGLSPEVFGVVDEKDQGTWDKLLCASRVWESVYSDPNPDTVANLMSMNPLAGSDKRFWRF